MFATIIYSLRSLVFCKSGCSRKGARKADFAVSQGITLSDAPSWVGFDNPPTASDAHNMVAIVGTIKQAASSSAAVDTPLTSQTAASSVGVQERIDNLEQAQFQAVLRASAVEASAASAPNGSTKRRPPRVPKVHPLVPRLSPKSKPAAITALTTGSTGDAQTTAPPGEADAAVGKGGAGTVTIWSRHGAGTALATVNTSLTDIRPLLSQQEPETLPLAAPAPLSAPLSTASAAVDTLLTEG